MVLPPSSSRPTRPHSLPETLSAGIGGMSPIPRARAKRLTFLAPAKIFTHTVNMNTLAGNNLSLGEKVVHVAYGCGCVRTFHVERNHMPRTQCATHGDKQTSFTEEHLKRRSAA